MGNDRVWNLVDENLVLSLSEFSSFPWLLDFLVSSFPFANSKISEDKNCTRYLFKNIVQFSTNYFVYLLLLFEP